VTRRKLVVLRDDGEPHQHQPVDDFPRPPAEPARVGWYEVEMPLDGDLDLKFVAHVQAASPEGALRKASKAAEAALQHGRFITRIEVSKDAPVPEARKEGSQ